MGTRFAIMGDIPGRFQDLAIALDRVRSRWGGIAFTLSVGDVEPNRGHEGHHGVVGSPTITTWATLVLNPSVLQSVNASL